jgi:MoaA/NifB/PqqE/SkfB family radical SAM enzyme
MLERVLFVNLTKLCNVNCPRCYLSLESRETVDRLDPEILRKALRSEFFSGGANVVVVFQGGEPTVVGKDALYKYASVVTDVVPGAKMAMVSNLYSVPDWLLEFAHDVLGGRLETTYANGKKMSLGGSEGSYQKRFRGGLKKSIEFGLNVPVNVELNAESIAGGVEFFVDLAIETGAKIWEFDFSVNFDEFREFPIYDSMGYPILPKTVTYEQFYNFVFDFQGLLSWLVGFLFNRELSISFGMA